MKWCPVFLAVLASLLTSIPAAAESDVTGVYDLRSEGFTDGPVVARMSVTHQKGTEFRIGVADPTGSAATDWSGFGVLEGKGGYYDWTFPDGKKGRTTFTRDTDGTWHGAVRGAGIDWDYMATRIPPPPALKP